MKNLKIILGLLLLGCVCDVYGMKRTREDQATEQASSRSRMIDPEEVESASQATLAREEERQKIVIGLGFDVNKVDSNGYTTLHYASAYGNRAVVELLIRAGADVNKVDSIYRFTPLHFASFKGHKEVVELLIGAGADVNKVDSIFGKNPLHDASKEGHKEVVEMLKRAGAIA